MFRYIDGCRKHDIEFEFDGEKISAADGQSVASAILGRLGSIHRESAYSGEPREPYCLMGACFECLVTIEGCGTRRACMVDASQGLKVSSQKKLINE